jgi:peptide/nickel transport system substrate-binding protein
VVPDDFRSGLERSIGLNDDALGLLGAIEGAAACRRERAACDLSGAIVTDDGSVTINLAHPDPDFPFKLALPFAFPVPSGTPIENQGLNPVPATGPYMVSDATGGQIELVRNPEFHEWSGAAQPDGFVEAISWRFGVDLGDGYDELMSGDTDVMWDPPAPDDLAALRAAHPDQVIPAVSTLVAFIGLDVLKPPFDDERVRQALSYALDRSHIVDLLGGPAVQRPTCQILPPNFQGYLPFCPFTLDPESGTWSAPDPDRAAALMRESGAIGDPVTVMVTDSGYVPVGSDEMMRYVTDVLNDLGLRAHLEVVHNGQAYFDATYGPPGSPNPAGTAEHPEAFLSGWFSDYPGASNYIEVQLSCDGSANVFGFCDPQIDARIQHALELQLTDLGSANRAWAEVEHDLVTAAPQVPLTNQITTYAVSDRTGNVQVSPQWGILLSRLWVQ